SPLPPGSDIHTLVPVRMPGGTSGAQTAAKPRGDNRMAMIALLGAGLLLGWGAALFLSPGQVAPLVAKLPATLTAVYEKLTGRKETSKFETVQPEVPKEPTAESLRNQGTMQVTQGDFDGAIRTYDEALKLDPNDAATRSARGVAWWSKGDPQKAVEDY